MTRFEIIEMEKPAAAESDILLRVLAASVCGSDVHMYEGPPGYEWVLVPIVLRHELTGEVVEVGSNVTAIAAGERITALPAIPCAQCESCGMGRVGTCRNRYVLGLTRNGAFAEYMLIKSGAEVLKIPDNVSNEVASLCEPLAICLNGIDLSGITPGQTAAVFGPGPIGLLTIRLFKAAGAGTIVATATAADKHRLDIAQQLGADAIVDVGQRSPVARMLGLPLID